MRLPGCRPGSVESVDYACELRVRYKVKHSDWLQVYHHSHWLIVVSRYYWSDDQLDLSASHLTLIWTKQFISFFIILKNKKYACFSPLILWDKGIVTGHSSWIEGLVFSIFTLSLVLFCLFQTWCSIYRFFVLPLSISCWNECVCGGIFGRSLVHMSLFASILLFFFHPTESLPLSLVVC